MSKPIVALSLLCAGLLACSSGPSGPCQDSCVQGQSQCVSGGIATCTLQGSCLAFSSPTPCAAGFVCSGGACALTCSDQCLAGAKRCEGALIEVCAAQSSGCTDWNTPTSCAGNVACTGDACPGCTDACTAGASACTSNTSVSSCTLGASGCLELVTNSCSGSDVCEAGQCGPAPVCTGCPSGYTCGAGGVCTGGNSTDLLLNVVTVTVSGAVTLNGALPVTGVGCRNYPSEPASYVTFHETTHGYNISAPIPCTTSDFSYSAALFPGTYKVTVDNGYVGTSANFPNVEYVVDNALVVNGDLTNQDFNVQTVTVSGAVTLNGALPATGVGCRNYPSEPASYVTFHETTHGYNISAPIPCTTGDFSYTATLFPGTYKVTVDNGYVGTSANFPNVEYVVKDSLVVNGNLSNQNFNVQTVTVSGAVTLNGALPITGVGCRNYPSEPASYVTFHETTHGYNISAAIPCTTSDFSYTAVVFPGTYKVTVDNGYVGTSANFPNVEYVVKDSLAVNGNLSNQNFNVQTVTVSGAVTLNGALPVTGVGCRNYPSEPASYVTFHETTHGYNISAPIPCTTSDFSYTAAVFPGTYKVTVDNGYVGTSANFPNVQYVVQDSLVVNGNLTNQDFNVQTVTVSGAVTLNGALPTTGAGCRNYPSEPASYVTFHETTHGYNISAAIPCTTGDFSYTASVFPGTYKVTVDNGYVGTSANFPNVEYVVQDALVVNGNLTHQNFNVQTVTVSGAVTLNGALPVTGAGCRNYPSEPASYVTFHEAAHGYNISAAIPCTTADFSFQAVIFPGTYKITVDNGYVGTSANFPNVEYVVVDAIALP